MSQLHSFIKSTQFVPQALTLDWMNAVKMAKHTGDIPQNVNFALKVSLVRDIDYETGSSKRELKTVDIFDKAKKFTVLVECLQ